MTKRAYVLAALLSIAFVGLLVELRVLRGPTDAEWRWRSPGLIKQYVATHDVRMLQLGAGENALTGWLDTDIEWSPGIAYLDCTEPYPVPDGSFRAVFSEHLIEHLPYESGERMMAESFRVLEPGGTVRVDTPDLRAFLALFSEPLTEEQQAYIKQKLRWHGWPSGVFQPTILLNEEGHQFGHQFLYDEATLTDIMQRAGFVNIKRYPIGQTGAPELRGAELRTPERFGEFAAVNAFEAMALEGTRP